MQSRVVIKFRSIGEFIASKPNISLLRGNVSEAGKGVADSPITHFSVGATPERLRRSAPFKEGFSESLRKIDTATSDLSFCHWEAKNVEALEKRALRMRPTPCGCEPPTAVKSFVFALVLGVIGTFSVRASHDSPLQVGFIDTLKRQPFLNGWRFAFFTFPWQMPQRCGGGARCRWRRS